MIPVMMLAACQPKETKAPALDPTDMDLSVKPGDNFFLYANGGWMKKNPLKAEYARFGSFDVLREKNVEDLNALFSEMTEMNPEAGTIDQKIVDLYKQGLDSTRLNAEGAAPIKKYLDELYAVPDKKALAAHLGKLNLVGEGGFFGGGVDADLMDSKTQIFYLGQGGLGMGDRDYYVDPANAELRKGYEAMLAKLFALAGLDKPEQRAANAAGVEDKLAEFSWTSVQNRDIEKLYNPMSSAQIFKAYPGFDFKTFCEAMGIPAMDKVIVEQPSYFQGFSKLFKDTPLDVLKDYLAGQLVSSAAGSLSDDFYAASFDFFSTQMSGVTEQKPRWKRAMSVPNSILGEAVGQMYVAKFFPESSKQKMLDLVKNLQVSLGQHIDSLEWMSDATKAKAREKLEAFTVKIGYPDKWKDYTTLNVDPQLSYYENLRAASAWYVQDNLSKLGKPTDPTEWGMTPQTVNAYYNPTTNEICFPAGILQKPFFDPEADDAVNYGGIGVVIGHEMSHGFDDQGSMFDAKGNMENWWTAEDKAKFDALGDKLAAQFDVVEVLPGVHANGRYTLGENIGDHGGLSIAYSALENALNGKLDKPVIDGFTPQQRFYLSYGNIWAQNITDQEKARLTNLDPHSLAENRVNVSVRNFQTFFDAFDIQEGDPMYRPEEERVHIW